METKSGFMYAIYFETTLVFRRFFFSSKWNVSSIISDLTNGRRTCSYIQLLFVVYVNF